MAYPYTETGENMYDLISLMQKAIRRADYEKAAWAASKLKGMYRNVMWNRLLVITSEDCFGVLTKEILALREMDNIKKDNTYIGRAIALMCKSSKNRDACYFACNFVIASRSPRVIDVDEYDIKKVHRYLFNDSSYDSCGFKQISLFDIDEKKEIPSNERFICSTIARLIKAIHHRDMDMIGACMALIKDDSRDYFWKGLIGFVEDLLDILLEEIKALKKADDIVNLKKKVKDEIFISKAVMIICQYIDFLDDEFDCPISSDFVNFRGLIDWRLFDIKDIDKCICVEIPEWTYDCHTLKGKRMGKTDWDMVRTEQEALFPLKRAYFDDGSWEYSYRHDVKVGTFQEEKLTPVWEYCKTHSPNPINFIPYD